MTGESEPVNLSPDLPQIGLEEMLGSLSLTDAQPHAVPDVGGAFLEAGKEKNEDVVMSAD